MRVAIPLEGHRVGGSHISAATMATALNRWTSVDARLVLGTKGPLSEILDKSNAKYDILSTKFTGRSLTIPRYAIFLAGDLPRIARFLKTSQIDLLHSGDSAIHITWGAAGRLLGLPHVWHQRGTKWPKRVPVGTGQLDVVAISKFVRDSLPTLPFRSLRVIYNPVDVPAISQSETIQCREAIRGRLGLRPNTRLIGFIANLVEYKRPDFFIDFANELMKTETNLHFIIAGREHDWRYQELNAIARRLGISNHVSGIGFYPQPLKLMSALDLIVIPAIDEPFGRTLPEAMQLEIPVIASDSGGHPESFPAQVRTRLADPLSPSDFASKARTILAGGTTTVDETRSLAEYAREAFSPRRHAQAVHNLYSERLGDGTSSQS